ncbi:MAG: gliding motility-associated C-terminal domain-containing protein [Bacteroidota bacterium]
MYFLYKISKRKIILIFCLHVFILQGQHNNNWALGWHSGITFNTVPPSTIKTAIANDTDQLSSAAFNCASYSDCNGNLIIYGNGNYLWNKNNKLLKNGAFDKYGYDNSLYMAALIPMAGNTRYIYFFYQRGCNQVVCSNSQKTYYAIIDLWGDNGLGEVTKKDIVLDSGAGNNCLAYTFHQNKNDIWLVHGVNNTTAHAYLIKDTGIIPSPVISSGVFSNKVDLLSTSIYKSIGGGTANYSHFKFTHDGKHLISTGIDSITTKAGCVFMYEFNNQTGGLQNPTVLMTFNDIFRSNRKDIINANYYFAEVSPNDSLIYLLSVGSIKVNNANDNRGELYQINRYSLSKSLITRFVNNQYAIGLQIGPDGKIYTMINQYYSQLCCVNRPNLTGVYCDFKVVLTDKDINIAGFPTVYQPYYKLYFTSGLTNNPCRDTGIFKIFVDTTFRHLTIYFGDGDSLEYNYPLLPVYTIKHSYKQTGNYYFNIKALNPDCNSYSKTGDSIFSALIPKKISSVKSVTPYCEKSQVHVKDSFINTTRILYNWLNGKGDTLNFSSGTASAISQTNVDYIRKDNPVSASWTTTIGNEACPNFNVYSDSLLLKYFPNTNIQYDINGYTSKKTENNFEEYQGCEPLVVNFKDTTRFMKKGTIHFSNGLFSDSTLNTQKFKFLKGDYLAVISDTSIYGCSSSDTFKIKAWEKPEIRISLSDTIQCVKSSSFFVVNNSINTDSTNYWYFRNNSDSLIFNERDSLFIKFDIAGNHYIYIEAFNKNGCKTTEDTAISVYPVESALFSINDTSQCLNDNLIIVKSASTGTTDCEWLMGDSTIYKSKGGVSVPHRYAQSGEYILKSITKTQFGCKDSFNKSISIYPNPQTDIILSDIMQCFYGHNANLQVSSLNADSIICNWGDLLFEVITGSKNLNHVYSQPAKYKIQATGISKGGCKDTVFQYINIIKNPSGQLETSGYCLGDSTKVSFKASGIKINNYQWMIDNKVIPANDSIVSLFFEMIGSKKISLRYLSDSQCPGSDSTVIGIFEKPLASFQFANLSTDGNLKYYFSNQSQKSTDWLWLFSNGDTLHRKNTYYYFQKPEYSLVTLIASNYNVCFDTMSQLIPVLNKIDFYFPNVFSPDGNNINDGFGINENQHEFVKEFHIEIYNRWGEKLFDSYDVKEKWEPSKSMTGIYVYKSEIRDIFNVLHEYKGVVEIIK